MDPNAVGQWIGAGSAIALLAVSIAFMFRSMYRQDREIQALRLENQQCNRRLGLLFRVVSDNRLTVPDGYWAEVFQAAQEFDRRDGEERGRK